MLCHVCHVYHVQVLMDGHGDDNEQCGVCNHRVGVKAYEGN